MSDKIKYVVLTKFANFKVGEVIELDKECPAAAQAHVRVFVEGENDSKEKKNQEAMDALKNIFAFVVGKPAGKTGAKKMEEAILKALEPKESEEEAKTE